MNTFNLSAALNDALPLILGCAIGAAIAYIHLNVPPRAARIRRQLGPLLHRYASIPQDQLDRALEAAAADARSGMGFLISVFSVVVMMTAAGVSAHIYRSLFSDLPRWHSYCIAGLVAGLLSWPKVWLERKTIARRLDAALRSSR